MKLLLTTISIAFGLTSHAYADPTLAIAVGNFFLASAGLASTSVAFITAVGYVNVSNAAKGIGELLNKESNQ